MDTPSSVRRLLPPLLVASAVVVSFAPALSAGFTNWDDDINLLNNPFYRGLGLRNLQWMFSTFLMGHYQPLAWLSLGVDYTVWGMAPFGYHLTAVLIHAANGVLLYHVLAALLRLGGGGANPWPAAIGALVYAIHPQRVESVAWITERRDVLCGLFTLLCLRFYLRAVDEERQGRRAGRSYVFSVVCFAGALLSKGLAVMLPLVLVLLDAWPLRRLGPETRRRALAEKIPFFALSLAGGIGMLLAARHIDALQPTASYSLPERAAQASAGLCHYLLKTVWPAGLIPLVRLESPMNPWAPKYVLAMLAVAAVTASAVALRRRAPWALAAWLAYGILVFPILGLVVTGKQLAADRYTYLALLPVSALVAAGLERRWSRPAAACAAAVLVALGAMTFRQAGFWQNSITLWTRQIDLDPGSETAFLNRGQARWDAGDAAGALDDCTRCLEISPGFHKAYNLRGFLRQKKGELAGARADYDRALELNPDHVSTLTNRGDLRRAQGDLQGALEDAEAALRKEAGAGKPRLLRANVLMQLGRPRDALADYDLAAVLRPDDPVTFVGRGQARFVLGDQTGAAEDLRRALLLAPPGWPLRKSVEQLLERLR